jgi:uracil-DNA glycosylase family 4
MTMADRAAMLADVAQEILTCQRCALGGSRTVAVPGEGPVNAAVMFIGEGPGGQEDRSGRPFVGAAGQLLDRLLLRAGLQRPDVYITNIVKCRPPANRDPLPGEVSACRPYLEAQIALISPRVICLLGKPATHSLLSPTASMGKVHGVPQEVDGIIYVPLYHPAAALHQPSMETVLVRDMERLKQFLGTSR